MAFCGGLCPLPGTLTSGAEEGWDAAQFKRFALDLAACKNTLPFAICTITKENGSVAEAVALNMQAPDLVDNQPVFSGTASVITVEFPAAPTDELGNDLPLNIFSVDFSSHRSSHPYVSDITGPRSFTITRPGSGTVDGTITVYATWGEVARPEDYGYSKNKRNSATEETPYSWIWYQELGATLGSGFSKERSGIVHARKLALARALQACSRAEQTVRFNATPHTATFALEDWAEVLNTPFSDNVPSWKTRARCAALFGADRSGSLTAIESAVYSLIGDRYIGIRVFAIDDDPSVWPIEWDLGGGVWATSRCRMLVDVVPPTNANDLEFHQLIEVDLMALMDRVTASHFWFNWTVFSDEGFLLDISPLDYTGL